jgi:hypothetical protein
VGLVEPGLWLGVAGGVGTVSTLAFRLIREKIRANRDRDLLRIALQDSTPEQRPAILGGLAKLRPLHPRSDDDVEPVQLGLPKGRRR